MAKEITFIPNSHNTDKENRVLKALQTDYENCKGYNKAWHKKMDKWTDEYMGMPYGNEIKGKSTIVTRDIKKHSEWLQSSILDPFVSTPDIIKCSAANKDSLKLARNAEMILNQQFCRQFPRYNFLTHALKVMDIEGTCVVKTGWDFLEEEREVIETQLVPLLDQNGNILIDPTTGQPPVDEQGNIITQEIKAKVKKKVRIIDKPTAEVVRNKDIYLDPSCLGNFENMQFIIHEYETDLSTLKSNKNFKNIDKIKPSKQDYDESNNYGGEDSTYFEFSDKPRMKVIVREYWGNYDLDGDGIAEPIVCAWVDNIVIRLEPNPFPDKKPPFIITPILPIPFQLTGEANAELLGDTQKLKSSIMRGFIDNMAASNNAQIGVMKGALDEENRTRMLEGENFEFNQTHSIEQAVYVGHFNQLPNSIFNLLQLIESEATQLTGVNTYGTNQTTNLLGENGASSRGVLDGGNLRKLMIVKNISENLIKPLMRKWLEYDAELLPEETIVRSTGNEESFEIIRRDDLYGSMDIDITISTNEDNAAKARELAFLLQTIGPNEDPVIRRIIMAEIMRLHKLYEPAYRIETYEPQPDPLQQELMMAQIENLKAQTQELIASAGRQQIDGSLKEAKIPVEYAKAKSLQKDVNMKGLDFYQKQNRLDQMANSALKEKEIDEKSKNERLKLQLEALDKMFQIEGQKARNGEPSIYSKISRDNRPKPKTAYSPSSEPNTARKLYE